MQVRVTYEDGDSDRYVTEALKRQNIDVIVAAGGDGSVNEVLLDTFHLHPKLYSFTNGTLDPPPPPPRVSH